MEAGVAAVRQRPPGSVAAPAGVVVLPVAAGKQAQIFPQGLAEKGTFIRVAQDHILAAGRKNSKPYLKTLGEAVDEPLDFLIIKNTQFPWHRQILTENCGFVHVFCVF
jgi:hypothetical protein